MSSDLLETFIRQYIEASPGPVIQFTWHGGEPSLAGVEFFRRAVRLQQAYLPDGWECWNNLQTNGVLIDDEWCSFLAEAKFDVGLSLDGAAWLHDAYRKDRGGRGTYERALAAVRRLQAHGIQPDLLCTVTSTAAKEPTAVYKALRDLGTGWIQFIPIVCRDADGRVTSDSVTPEGYGRFLSAVFDEWLYNDIGRSAVQQFAEISMVWSGGTAGLCWMAPTCGRAVIVEKDGSVYSCDHFVNPEHRVGSLETAHLGELVESPIQRDFGADKQRNLPGRCRACAWLAICNGGCPKDRFIDDENGDYGLYYLCDGLRQFFAHAETPLKQVTALMNKGVSPAEIMARLRAEEAEKWKGVGRNDPCPCGSGLKAKRCCMDKRV